MMMLVLLLVLLVLLVLLLVLTRPSPKVCLYLNGSDGVDDALLGT